VNLGLALEHLGDKTGALSAFQKALVLDPENVPLQQTVQELGGSL
jgi:tetratricopeptide (TPR) repeat protein